MTGEYGEEKSSMDLDEAIRRLQEYREAYGNVFLRVDDAGDLIDIMSFEYLPNHRYVVARI